MVARIDRIARDAARGSAGVVVAMPVGRRVAGRDAFGRWVWYPNTRPARRSIHHARRWGGNAGRRHRPIIGTFSEVI